MLAERGSGEPAWGVGEWKDRDELTVDRTRVLPVLDSCY